MLQTARALVDWQAVDTVFLDMDGTLLDLHFDNHFWREHLPKCWGARRGLSAQQARTELGPRFSAIRGTLQWYSLEYWSRELGLDVLALHRELRASIRVFPETQGFLRQLRGAGKRLVLLTNAHPDTLALKMEQTHLAANFDRLLSSHDLGAPKETPDFWQALARTEKLDRRRSLFVDDSLPVLRAARGYGLRNLVVVCRPDSAEPARLIEEFASIETLAELLP